MSATRRSAYLGTDPVALLSAAYLPVIEFAERVDEATGWTPTQLPGWTVRDLLVHLAGDCQRALVALHTPTAHVVDSDDVTYWSRWRPDTSSARDGLRGTRIMASAWSSVRDPADLYAGTARAVLNAAADADPDLVVATQGHVLAVRSLLGTLAVETTVHHLDLAPALDTTPDTVALGYVRELLEALMGQQLPAEWDDVRCALLGTGRAPVDDDARELLGPLAGRLPLFG